MKKPDPEPRQTPYSAELTLTELLRREETFEEWKERTSEPEDGWERRLKG